MKTTVYLQVQPERGRHNFNRRDVQSMNVVNMTKNYPTKVPPDTIVVKVTLDVPVDNFNMKVVQLEVEEASPIRAVS